MMIRPATSADLPAIAALHAANWRSDYAHVLSQAALGAPLEAQIARLWGPGGALDTGWQVWLMPGQGSLAGFVLARLEADGVHVGALHVAAGQRGRGVGAGLMARAGQAAGDHPVWLEVLAGNAAARAIYRHWGGQEGAPYSETFLGAPVQTLRVDWPEGRALAARLGGIAPS